MKYIKKCLEMSEDWDKFVCMKHILKLYYNRHFASVLTVLCLIINVLLLSCKVKVEEGSTATAPDTDEQEDVNAKTNLQGIWINDDTQTLVFKIINDSIFYPDGTNLPAYFKVVGDSLIIEGDECNKYKIVKLGQHTFSFISSDGACVNLSKSVEMIDSLAFVDSSESTSSAYNNKVEKQDTVIFHEGNRYHCYTFINPSKNKIYKSTYNEEGLEVRNCYYDNIIHLSLFEGKKSRFSRDFSKNDFKELVPSDFLKQAVFSDARFTYFDDEGAHYDATVCIPDDAKCYMIQIIISVDGKYELKLLDY